MICNSRLRSKQFTGVAYSRSESENSLGVSGPFDGLRVTEGAQDAQKAKTSPNKKKPPIGARVRVVSIGGLFYRRCFCLRLSSRCAFLPLTAVRNEVSRAINSFKSFSSKPSKMTSTPTSRRAFKIRVIAFIQTSFLQKERRIFPSRA